VKGDSSITKIKRLCKWLYNVIIRRLIRALFHIVPINNNKIVVCNFYGKGYGESPKAIIEAIKKIDVQGKLDIVWLLEEDNYKTFAGDRIRKVKYNSLQSDYELITSRIWIDNTRKFNAPLKRKKQFYIQTWHGGIALKKVEKATQDTLSKIYVKQAKIDSKNIDLLISCGTYQTKNYRNNFWYDGDIIEIGTPKNDILVNGKYNNELKTQIKEKLCIGNKNVVLYAPTFRNDATYDYDLDYKKLCNHLKEKTGKDWICVRRLHPNVVERNVVRQGFVLDESQYDDMTELLLASDLLITDYSSLMFEYALLDRPVILYLPDKDEYISERSLAIDMNELPFIECESMEGLVRELSDLDIKNYVNKVKKYMTKLGIKENGIASETIAQIIMDRLANKN